jgi:hypothetical protein
VSLHSITDGTTDCVQGILVLIRRIFAPFSTSMLLLLFVLFISFKKSMGGTEA